MDMTELCQELRNWFERDKKYGEFTISDEQLNLSDFLLDGQYYRIIGSVFNDGVHKYGDDSDVLNDETFKGEIWALAIPKAVIDLQKEISEWLDKNGEKIYSPFSSESFDGYSYTKSAAGGSDFASVQVGGWQSVFIGKLNKWRKI